MERTVRLPVPVASPCSPQAIQLDDLHLVTDVESTASTGFTPLICLVPSCSPPSSPQGIYLNEHRNYGGPRRLVITVQVGRKGGGV